MDLPDCPIYALLHVLHFNLYIPLGFLWACFSVVGVLYLWLGKNPSGTYKSKCNTCNNAYIGQSGRSITVRHREHIRYVQTINPTSAYALHILNNKHEYGNASETLELLKPCHKGTCMNCWKTFYIQAFHQHKTLITERQVSDINPLYELADTSHIPVHTP